MANREGYRRPEGSMAACSRRAAQNKKRQLGISIGTAKAKLNKIIMFDLAKKCNENVCYRCGKVIETKEELSIDHKVRYLDTDDPFGLFFDLNNIAFSHLICNTKASRKVGGKLGTIHADRKEHGLGGYKRGCRCEICVAAMRERSRKGNERERLKRLQRKLD